MITSHPGITAIIAEQEIEQRIRDAEARRSARDVRRAARAAAAVSPQPRRWPIQAFTRRVFWRPRTSVSIQRQAY